MNTFLLFKEKAKIKNETLIFKNETVREFSVRIKNRVKNALKDCLFYYKTAIFNNHSDTLLKVKSAVNTEKKPFSRHKKWTAIKIRFVSKLRFLFGGGGGSWTPVRKHFLRNLSGRRRLFTFPCHDVSRHTAWFGSFIVHAGGKAYSGHVHHSGHAQAQLVVLLGWTAASSRSENFVIVVL